MKKHTSSPFFIAERKAMIEEQLLPRGISDERVLAAMQAIPREMFVLTEERHLAHRDGPLPIGQFQTISQPYIVAYMTEQLELESNHRVLEIGTGSGYQTAVLAACSAKVFTVEIIECLGQRARHILENQLCVENVAYKIGNGNDGWPEHAPFDRIMLTAAPIDVPEALIEQLAPGGRLIAPVGDLFQTLILLEKDPLGHIKRHNLLSVRFVPMTG